VIRTLLRITLALPLLAAGLGAASITAGAGPAAPLCAQAAFSHRVGLVVEHGDGQVIRRCVGFDTPTATALALLQASALEVGISSYGGGLGAAVCQIDNEPASYPPGCFTSSGSYWVLFLSRAGGAWVDSDLGASSITLVGGDDLGFRFDSQTGADPPPPSPAGTCPEVTPPPRTPAPSEIARSTPRAAASSTSGPSSRASAAYPVPTPASGVLGLVGSGATPSAIGALARAAAAPGVNAGLLLAAVGAGALIGLLGARSLMRRRE
jgi:hypothetical protein